MQKYLESLNDEQLRAAISIKGAYRLVAGAGSGKTNTLTKRVAYICESQNIPVERVLSLTFTNKAAGEMKERVAELMNITDLDRIKMCTFHKLCLEILQEEGEGVTKLGWGSNDFEIYESGQNYLLNKFMRENSHLLNNIPDIDVKEKWKGKKAMERNAVSMRDRFRKFLAKELDYEIKYGDYIKYLDLDYEDDIQDLHYVEPDEFKKVVKGYQQAEYKVERIKDEIKGLNKKLYEASNSDTPSVNSMSDDTFTANKYAKELVEAKDELKKFKGYFKPWIKAILRQKISSNIITYDDLISMVVYLFKKDEELLEEWQEKFDYIQIDEAQDTDSKQLELIQLLYKKHGNLFVVGDPDQSIYLFRGAEPELFNRLDEYIPGLVTIKMEKNYRSNQSVVNLSNRVIQLNENRLQKTCVSQGTVPDSKAKLILLDDIAKTTNEVVTEIKSLLDKGVNTIDIAILYQSRSSEITGFIVKELTKLNIPLDNTFPTKSTKEEEFDTAIECILKYNYTKNEYFLIKLLDCESVYKALSNSVIDSLDKATQSDILKIVSDIASKIRLKDAEYESIITEWFELSDSEKSKRCIIEDSLVEHGYASGDGIHIITMHKSKGLEWRYVFVIGQDMSARSSKECEEYARLYYVAYSRAKEGLYIIANDIPTLSQLMVDKDVSNYLDTQDVDKDSEMWNKSLETYRGTMDRYGFGKQEYRKLVKGDELLGYRCIQYIGGKKIGFDASLSLVEQADRVPRVCFDKSEVLDIEGSHFVTFDEINNVMQIVDLINVDDVKYVFASTPMPLIVNKCVEQAPKREIKTTVEPVKEVHSETSVTPFSNKEENEGLKNILFIGETPVALRLTKDGKMYDVSIQLADKLGIDYRSKLGIDFKKIQLRKINDLWMSASEYKSGVIITELAEKDKELILSML